MPRIPESLMARFRAAAMERLERIDTAWAALVLGEGTAELEVGLLRDVHTLKGDAKVVGLGDASVLCQRLEDLLGAARERRYAVHEDVDFVVTMAIQFLVMIVRKESSTRSGIDIEGFTRQVEQVMSEWLVRPMSAGTDSPPGTAGQRVRIREHERRRASGGALSAAVTQVFVEHLRGTGEARARLYDLWLQLVEGHNESARIPIQPLLAGNAAMARELAADLGKSVVVAIEGAETTLTPETGEALGVFAMHALRNAVDHGIEAPSARTRAGKPSEGQIRVNVRRDGDLVHFVVSDDGAGIDLERVRGRAIEHGLLSAELAGHASDEEVIECLFATGLSTRDATTETSGRGIGLDAAQAALANHGGSLRIERPTAGLLLVAATHDVRGTINVIGFGGVGSSVTFAVPSVYGVRRTSAEPTVVLEEWLCIPTSGERVTSALEIFWDTRSIVVASTGLLVPHRAWRRCPTSDRDLIEVVSIGESPVLLIRPEVLYAQLEAANVLPARRASDRGEVP